MKWEKTNRPFGSEHLECEKRGARVRPVNGRWEWSVWIGPPGLRVMHNNGTLASKSAAKRKAAAACKR